MTRILTSRELATLLAPRDCLAAVEEAFRAHGEGRTAAPASVGLHAAEGTFHIKAAVGDVVAVKVNANFPANPAVRGLPTIQGLILVMDAACGTPLAILDSALVTALRTAAATALAARWLARRDASTATIIGCGMQAAAQLEALTLVRPLRRAFAIDLDSAASARFARDMTARLGIEVLSAASPDEAIAASEIVVTCTTARKPLLDAHHLHRGLFIAAVGADNPQKQELAPALLRASRVVTDILEQAAAMGDLHHAIEAGVMTRADVHGELADLVCGRIPGRRDDDEIFVFDSTGTALQDVAVASLAVARARELGMGLEIELG